MEDLEYEERAAKVMPKWSSWSSRIVEIKRKYWYESRDRIISILKQLHRAKKQAKRIKELEKKIEAAKEILGSQSFWCELADQECVGLKSIVYLVSKALKG